MAPSEPLSPVERLFMEAGRSRISYGIWRAITLPSLKINATVSSVLGGWLAEDLDDEETELKLARRWLEAEARKRDAKEDKPVPNAAATSAVPLGPLMTTREVREVLEERRKPGGTSRLKPSRERSGGLPARLESTLSCCPSLWGANTLTSGLWSLAPRKAAMGAATSCAEGRTDTSAGGRSALLPQMQWVALCQHGSTPNDTSGAFR